MAQSTLLDVRGLTADYGAAPVLTGVDLTVGEGEIVVIVGPNGAGKTTTLKALCGLIAPSGGEVTYRGRSILGRGAKELVRQGVVLCPEGRELFPDMSVLENLRLGTYALGRQRSSDKIDEVYDLFPRLKERLQQRAGTLSGGEQQMLAVGRSLMAEPKLLLLDEPSLGLAPMLVSQLFELLEEVNRRGTTVLLVEQNAVASLKIADRGYVLENGKIVAEDTSQELLADPRVAEAYLGGGSASP